MRLCFLADLRSIHTVRWISFFAENHDVDLISFDYPEKDLMQPKELELAQKGVSIHKISKNILRLPFSAFVVRRLIKKINPDVVHAHYVLQYGFFGAFSGIHPFVITAWGSDVLIDPKKSVFHNAIIKYALNHADLLTCDGDNTRLAMIGFGQDKQKIKKILFGVDTKKYNPNKRDKNKFIDIFGECPDKVIIYIRGFREVYDAGTLIDAIPLILKETPDAKFVLAGGGEQKEDLQKKVESMGYSISVKFVGNISQNDLPYFLASSDVYVSTSLSDSGIAASTAEAMASGLPVVSSECGDIHEWIEDGINGYIFPKGKSDILAKQVTHLLSDRNTRESFGRKCREIIETRQDYYKEMKKVEQAYRELKEGRT